jgi:hypothetical protein
MNSFTGIGPKHGNGLEVCRESLSPNPRYWQFKGQPVLLLGGSIATIEWDKRETVHSSKDPRKMHASPYV